MMHRLINLHNQAVEIRLRLLDHPGKADDARNYNKPKRVDKTGFSTLLPSRSADIETSCEAVSIFKGLLQVLRQG